MYSLKDISKMTQLTTRTLQNHLKEGLLKGSKIGRSWRFSEEDLKSYLNQNKIQNQLSNKAHEEVENFLKESKDESCILIKLKNKDYANLQNLAENIANYINLNITKDLKTYKAIYDQEEDLLEILLIGSLTVVFDLSQYIYQNLEEGE